MKNQIEGNNIKFKTNLQNLLYPPHKTKSVQKNVPHSEVVKSKKSKKRKKDKKKRKTHNYTRNNKEKIDNKIRVFSKYNSSKNALAISQNDKFINLNNKKRIINNNKNETEIENKKEYDDFELKYKKALKYDKRSLLQVYLATLKREQLIIFTFINCIDYNLLYIKLSRFVFLLVGHMALNAFFFSGDSMHRLFLNCGTYDFIQKIPQIVYSIIISQLIELFLCFLSLTDKHIYQIKSALKSNKEKSIQKIIKCIYIKLISFYIFTFIFFIIYWYIITVFCGVYRNTQKHFITDSIISFSIYLIYPFALYFISASLRICALKSSKKNLRCIYNLSSIIPFF